MYQIIEVPSSLGAPDIKSGMEQGPAILSAAFKNIDTLTGEIDRIKVPVPQYEHALGEYINSKYLPEIIELNRNIRKQVKKAVISKNIPLILMGDDSSTIGAVYGLTKSNPDIGIVWFDAHGDINIPETSPSGCFYGMGLAHIMGFGHPQILKLNSYGDFIDPTRVGMIGQRNFDPDEIELVTRCDIKLITVESVRQNPELQAIKLINHFNTNGVNSIYIHYDLDVFDPIEDPPVFAPNLNGLFFNEVSVISQKLKEKFTIAGISIANYIPDKDKHDFKGKLQVLINEVLSLG